jgi:hypothetical protein
MAKRLLMAFLAFLAVALPAVAQQTGAISGTVTLEDGSSVPGIVIEASSPVLPRPRATTTLDGGFYSLAQLPPGEYTVTYAMDGMATQTRQVRVSLDQTITVDITLGMEALSEQIDVVAEATLIDRASAEINDSLTSQEMELIPVGQDYRDLQKLIAGVQYSDNVIRGPSAGGSGQDNTYQFDGVNVNFPLFGTLSGEPSKHDIAEVSVVKGGARAVGFNRAGGFLIDTVSKSGTNEWRGEVSYQLQSASLREDSDDPNEAYDEERDYATAGIGGPIVRENLYGYASYYRPTQTRSERRNVYGNQPDFESTRDEFFGKLTWTPTSSVLVNGSYRDASREDEAASINAFASASTARGDETDLEIAILEGSWILNDRNLITFKATDFTNDTLGRPDNESNAVVALNASAHLDINNLEGQGHLFLPTPLPGQAGYNDFIAPIINRYGYLQNGVRTGGGDVGVHHEFNGADYARESYQLGWDITFGNAISHDLHVGYQWMSDEEALRRRSNGWGEITVPGGRSGSVFNGQPIFYTARVYAAAAGAIPVSEMVSEIETQNFEINDTIRWNNFTLNAGLVVSNDVLYGQGLRPDSSKVSGFSVAPGNRYEMYEIDWEDTIQPRLGLTWAYNGRDTFYASAARYVPAASSLPRAASWDRNFYLRTIDVHFDQNGNFIGAANVAGSSGKLFADDLDPRFVDEVLLGTARQVNANWTARLYGRYRYSANFWEDTENNSRLRLGAPGDVPRTLYIPTNDLVGTGSYVIAELDGAHTKYYEATLETERRGGNLSFRGSYTWSHYYGNFDQDNTTADNDQNIFIGSSFIADSAGRQVWDNRYGNLHGDRRHLLKVYGSYALPWKASIGAFGLYQSGEPWETWDVEAYRPLLNSIGSTSTSSISRFAEPSGSRESDDHYQIDLNYTQDFALGGSGMNVQGMLEIFNVTNNQTGYDIEPIRNLPNYGTPRAFYDPRRIRIGVKLEF